MILSQKAKMTDDRQAETDRPIDRRTDAGNNNTVQPERPRGKNGLLELTVVLKLITTA